MEFNEWLSQQITKNGYTPASFAKRAGFSKQAIYNYLDGRLPDRGGLEKIATALRIAPEEVFKIAVKGYKNSNDPWAEEMTHKLSSLDESRKSIAGKLLDALLDEQEKEQASQEKKRGAKP